MGCERMEKIIERKFVAIVVLLLLVVSSIVSFTGNMPTVYTVKADNNWEDCSNNASAHHNTSWLNVTIESKYPRILWYDIQVYTGNKEENSPFAPEDTESDDNWVSIRNNMTVVDNATWLRFVINISSDQGWENIKWINMSGWHDNGTDGDGTGYNATGNHGSNRNFFLYYENLTGESYYNISWPTNGTELTKGNFSERTVTDPLGIDGATETKNLTFEFKPGYQFRYAPGPDGTGNTWINHSVVNSNGYPETDGTGVLDYETSSWTALNNTWSWNFNMTVTNNGSRGTSGDNWGENFSSWVLDEFGVYSYTEIVSATDAHILGAPGENSSTNSTNPYNTDSVNVTVETRSNGNYSLVLNISDLRHSAWHSGLDPATSSFLTLDNETIWVRGGTRTDPLNFSQGIRNYINLYGTCNLITGLPGTYEDHEVNGTKKYTGEAANDGKDALYPNHYNSGTYGSLNDVSNYIEFTCDIPAGQWAGKYSTNVYYHLRTHTIS